ncbi:MAG: hypothetical protein Q9M44_07645 [Ghiorsea sp.]|nr:hypothetical protein [Ghiorsea sp.]
MLRPAFTQQLADHLLSGQSIYLVSPHGRGRRQTLEDLLPLLSRVTVQKIDLKRQQDTWERWLERTLALSSQAVVIIHNFNDYFSSSIASDLAKMSQQDNLTFLCVVEHEITHDLFSSRSMVLPKKESS